MRAAFLTSLLAFLVGLGHGQQAPPEPACNSYVMQKTINFHPEDFSLKQRSCVYFGKLISGQAFFGPTFMGGVAQFRDDPLEWGQGTKGYLRRVGTRYAQGVAKSTGEFVFSSMLRENPRYEPSIDKSRWRRAGHALSTVVVANHLGGGKWPAFSKMVGAASSGLVGLSWYPGRLNTTGQVLARTGSAYGGYVASALFSEFQADVFGLLGKMVGSDHGSPSPKSETTKGGK